MARFETRCSYENNRILIDELKIARLGKNKDQSSRSPKEKKKGIPELNRNIFIFK